MTAPPPSGTKACPKCGCTAANIGGFCYRDPSHGPLVAPPAVRQSRPMFHQSSTEPPGSPAPTDQKAPNALQ